MVVPKSVQHRSVREKGILVVKCRLSTDRDSETALGHKTYYRYEKLHDSRVYVFLNTPYSYSTNSNLYVHVGFYL